MSDRFSGEGSRGHPAGDRGGDASPAGESLSDVLALVNRAALAAVERVLPVDAEALRDVLLWPGERDDSVALGPRLVEAIALPVRLIADRGGKGWRSYTIQASCEAVGGDFEPYLDWLALPEVLHVGSLIIDDVQDGSTVRRGGPACHMVHGVPIAINAACTAYFVVQRLIQATPEEIRAGLYEEYVSLLRAAHVGQGLDLLGVGAESRSIADGGDGEALVQLILHTHRLKSGIAFRGCARMGARLGRATPAQRSALGEFFLATGTAFQIIDDVLNLEGFSGGQKERGEDLRHGKVTLPVAVLLRGAAPPERAPLLRLLEEARYDERARSRALERIAESGALSECRDSARGMIDASRAALRAALPASPVLDRIEAFSVRLLERVY